MNSIACIIPTFNAKDDLARLLESLKSQTLPLDIIIVDSSSTDGTRELANRLVHNVTVISPSDFNHGGTRQLMIDKNPQYEVYVFLTQDACLVQEHAIERLVKPFGDPLVGAVCGRQLPHLDATHLSQHARLFNYPPVSQLKKIADVPELGLKTAFMSNSFSAYRGEALKNVGGFPKHVIFGEDMFVAAKMLMSGWKIAYAGDALCRHSHNYTVFEEFSRYFDMGVFHVREPWIRETFGGAGGEGFRYVKSELRYLGLQRLYLWPSALCRSAAKLIGYKLGKLEAHIPASLKVRFSMYKRYWNGPFSNS